MPRPTRYDAPAIKRQVYLSPEASTLLDQWCAGVHGRAPGHLLDMLLRQHLGSPVVPEAKGLVQIIPAGVAPHSPSPTEQRPSPSFLEHRWDQSAGSANSLGKHCLDCGARSSTPKGNRPCPGASL